MGITAFALLFTLTAIGISETSYLIRKRKASEKPICPIGGGCSVVLSSKYNSMFGVHNDVMGRLFYIFIAFMTAFLVIGVEPIQWWYNISALAIAGAAVMSLILTYLQWRVLKSWCFWCVMSALTVAGMAVIIGLHFVNNTI